MNRTELAKDYTISRIVRGCWQLAVGHSNPVDSGKAIDDLVACVRGGITTFDCADIYTGVESLIGAFRREYVKRSGREALGKLQIHTKFVPDLDELPQLNRAYVERIIDRSLQRLGMERLDLVQFHWWDFEIPGYVDTAYHLQDLKKAGKILHLGVTNFDVPRLKEILRSGVEIVSNQVQYSFLDQRPENGMVGFAQEYGIKLLCYGSLAGGFVSERYLGVPEPHETIEDRSLTNYQLVIDDFGGWELFQELLTALQGIAKKHRVSIANIATRWVLDKPGVAGVILGARNTSHLDDILRVLDFSLDESDLSTIWNLLTQSKPLPDDVYSLERVRGGKHAKIMRCNQNAQ